MTRGLRSHDRRMSASVAAVADCQPHVAPPTPRIPDEMRGSVLPALVVMVAPASDQTRAHTQSGQPLVVPATGASVRTQDARAVFVQPPPGFTQQGTRDGPLGAGVAAQTFPVVFQLEFGIQIQATAIVDM